MKQINTYINEKLRLSAKTTYTCQPKDKDELRKIIIARIKNEGHDCDLNDIDVSKITDMSHLFATYAYRIFENFNCDISMWDVSNVTNMNSMFYGCEQFNCDISRWNVSKVVNMNYMFWGCTKFNQDLNKWDASKVAKMRAAFRDCPTQPTWYDKDKCE